MTSTSRVYWDTMHTVPHGLSWRLLLGACIVIDTDDVSQCSVCKEPPICQHHIDAAEDLDDDLTETVSSMISSSCGRRRKWKACPCMVHSADTIKAPGLARDGRETLIAADASREASLGIGLCPLLLLA